jgi:hypothetical protein
MAPGEKCLLSIASVSNRWREAVESRGFILKPEETGSYKIIYSSQKRKNPRRQELSALLGVWLEEAGGKLSLSPALLRCFPHSQIGLDLRRGIADVLLHSLQGICGVGCLRLQFGQIGQPIGDAEIDSSLLVPV